MPRNIIFTAIILFIGATLCFAQEEITITTYYPSPYGSYGQLTVAQDSTYDDESTNAVEITDATSGTVGLVMGADTTLGHFYIQSLDPGTSYTTRHLLLNPNGARVGIGTVDPGYTLDVNGDINTSGDVRQSGTAYNNPDYVFDPEYKLMSMGELKKFVAKRKHLPNMPSSEEIKKQGVKIFEQNRLMLEKLEEAYLYIIKLQERIEKLEAMVGHNPR